MMNPDEYTVLHVGQDPEHDKIPTPTVEMLKADIEEELSPVRVKAATMPRKDNAHFRAMLIVIFFALGLMFLTLIFTNFQTNTQLSQNENYIASLIDEVGGLQQDKYVLSEQLDSQEAVLKSIEKDFSSIQGLLEGSSKSSEDFSPLLAEINDEFTKSEEVFSLTKQVSTTPQVKDGTFDILILGTNGAHTDTIMVASVNESKQKVALFSIPRDLYINGRRINAYYNSYGVDQLERMVESVSGLKIDQFVQVDLDGFVKIVDLLGGLDIEVEKSIYDGMYPNKKGGYEAYSIEAGNYHMTGEQALKYARSRKSTSDFDRAARQQKTLNAMKTKVEQLDLVMDLKSLTKLFQAVMTYSKTDIDLFDAVGYYTDYRDFQVESGFVLSSSNYLYSKINESGAYILLPKSGNFDEIHGVISDLVN